MTQLISTIAIAMGASWVSGINLYATVATLGLLGRFAHLQLPGELEVLTSWWVIGVAVVLYVIEFVADKVPYVDSTWDVIHTFIRVPGRRGSGSERVRRFRSQHPGDCTAAGRRSRTQLSRNQSRDTRDVECES